MPLQTLLMQVFESQAACGIKYCLAENSNVLSHSSTITGGNRCAQPVSKCNMCGLADDAFLFWQYTQTYLLPVVFHVRCISVGSLPRDNST